MNFQYFPSELPLILKKQKTNCNRTANQSIAKEGAILWKVEEHGAIEGFGGSDAPNELDDTGIVELPNAAVAKSEIAHVVAVGNRFVPLGILSAVGIGDDITGRVVMLRGK